jgi:hypothetical protein
MPAAHRIDEWRVVPEDAAVGRHFPVAGANRVADHPDHRGVQRLAALRAGERRSWSESEESPVLAYEPVPVTAGSTTPSAPAQIVS